MNLASQGHWQCQLTSRNKWKRCQRWIPDVNSKVLSLISIQQTFTEALLSARPDAERWCRQWKERFPWTHHALDSGLLHSSSCHPALNSSHASPLCPLHAWLNHVHILYFSWDVISSRKMLLTAPSWEPGKGGSSMVPWLPSAHHFPYYGIFHNLEWISCLFISLSPCRLRSFWGHNAMFTYLLCSLHSQEFLKHRKIVVILVSFFIFWAHTMCQAMSKVFIYINSFNPHNNLVRKIPLLFPCYRQENSGTEKLRNLWKSYSW